VLRPLREVFPAGNHPDLLVGLGSPDDAAVWRLDDDRALVLTTDFFTPVVDDAYTYGSIAAANALSDLYAMGAAPMLALNVAAIPVDLPPEVVEDIFRGGAEKVREAGAVIAGGHTVQDREPKYGLVAIGLCRISELMTKDRARPGDVLILTKPLGTGVTTTALRAQAASASDVEQVVVWMQRLNAPAAALARRHTVRAATDVTGFGLLGHGFEMGRASSAALRLHAPSIPLFGGAPRYMRAGHYPGGSADNHSYFSPHVAFDPGVDEVTRALLFDAQTSGGLLLAVPAFVVEPFLEDARVEGVAAWAVGEVEDGAGVRVVSQAYDGVRGTGPGLDEELWYPAEV
jgi:selenide,water dikinase